MTGLIIEKFKLMNDFMFNKMNVKHSRIQGAMAKCLTDCIKKSILRCFVVVFFECYVDE